MKVLYGFLLSTIFTVVSINGISNIDIIHVIDTIIDKGTIRFIDNLNYDEMINLLEIIRQMSEPRFSNSPRIEHNPILKIKLDIFFAILGELWQERRNIINDFDDFDEEDDFNATNEEIFWLHELYSVVYDRAQEIILQRPYDKYGKIIFLQQLSPDIIQKQLNEFLI